MELTIADMQASYRRLWIGVLCGIVLSILKIILQLWMPYGFLANPAANSPYLPQPAAAQPPPSQSQTVTIGAALPAVSNRAYYTTEEVADRENISARTVLSYIAAGRITPAPARTDRAWQIAKDYQITADSRVASAGQ